MSLAGLRALRVKKTEVYIIAGLVFLAVVLRLWYIHDYTRTSVYPLLEQSDSEAYAQWGRDIASGEIISAGAFMKWPLYAYMLGLLFGIFGYSPPLVYGLQFLIGSVNCVLVYLITRRLARRNAAIIAAGLYLSYGLFIFYEGLMMYVTLALFFNLLILLILLRYSGGFSIKGVFLFGLLAGVSGLTQANSLIFAAAGFAWLLLRAERPAMQKKRQALVFLITAFSVTGLATLHNFAAEKDFVPIAGNLGFNFYSGNNSQASGTFYSPPEVALNQEDMFRDARIIAEAQMGKRLKTSQVSRYWLQQSFNFMISQPGKAALLGLKKIVYALSPQEYVHDLEFKLIYERIGLFKFIFMDLRFILPMVLLGVVVSWKRRRDFALLYIGIIVLALSLAVFFVTARYRLVIIPLFLILAAVGTSAVWEAWGQKHYRYLGLLAAAAALSFFWFNSDLLGGKRTGAPPAKIPSVEGLLFQGISLEQQGDYPAAILKWESAVRLDPANRRVQFRLGVANYNIGNYSQAESNFKAVGARCPLCVDAFYNLGLLYNLQQRYNEAEQMLLRAVALDPKDARIHFELARVYKARGDLQAARAEFLRTQLLLPRWNKADQQVLKAEMSDLPQ